MKDIKKTLFIIITVLCLIIIAILITLLVRNKTVSTNNDNSLTYANYEEIEKKAGFDINSLKETATNLANDSVSVAKQIDKSFSDKLEGKGYLFAAYALKYNIDPYLAAAIVLHETGCNHKCSAIVNNKNNVGGMRGSGEYLSFNSIDEGIKAFLDNLYYNYYTKGLDTPEKMNPKYAASQAWSAKIHSYIKQIKEK